MRTRIKIAFLIAVTTCFLGVLIGFSTMFVSSDNNPTTAFAQFCGYVSEGDYRAVVEMTGNSVEAVPDDRDDGIENLIISKLLQNIKIEVLSEPNVNAITAKQQVMISHIDMSILMKKLFSGVLTGTADYEWNHGSYETDEEIIDAINDCVIDQLDGNLEDCVVTETIIIEFHYKDGKWFPVMTKELYKALTGNAAEASDNIAVYIDDYQKNTSVDTANQ